MGVYTEAYYHFVWATRKREWFISEAVERDLHRYIQGKCDVLRVHIYAMNGMPDHVHLVVGLPATLSVSDFVEAIKGASSHYINHLPEQENCLYWQPGYGLLTFARSALDRIILYVENQKQHHAVGGLLSPKMERTADWESPSQPHEVGVPGVRAQ
ncbi:MAG: IS200/IS605 family transposase [Janthinobacterium lividum]